jgi:two-component system, NarL family, response regulator NreC
MSEQELRCALVADPHHAMSEGVRGLLATMFKTVVMVADEASLFASADLLRSDLAVVDLALARGEGLELVRRLRGRFPDMKLIIISVHDQSSVSRSVLAAGANGFVVRRAIGADLLAAADAVFAGQRYVSPAAAGQIRDSL